MSRPPPAPAASPWCSTVYGCVSYAKRCVNKALRCPGLCSHPAEDGGRQSARGEGEGQTGQRRIPAGGRRRRCGEGHPSTIHCLL